LQFLAEQAFQGSTSSPGLGHVAMAAVWIAGALPTNWSVT